MKGYLGEIVGCALVLAVALMLIDWAIEDSFSWSHSALKGAALGAFFGLVERPIRRGLRRRSS